MNSGRLDRGKQINREAVDMKVHVMMISESNENQMKDLPNRTVEKQESNKLKHGNPVFQLPRGMLLKEGKLPDSSLKTAFDKEDKVEHNIREISDTLSTSVDKAKQGRLNSATKRHSLAVSVISGQILIIAWKTTTRKGTTRRVQKHVKVVEMKFVSPSCPIISFTSMEKETFHARSAIRNISEGVI